MECRFVGNFFRTICIATTGALFLRGGLKYFEDESSSLVKYRSFFQDRKRDIYPTLSLCFHTSGPKSGLYDGAKLNETYAIEDPVEYQRFLEGTIWDDSMLEVRYDDVTFDIKDQVENISVIGSDGRKIYTWDTKDERTNDTTRTSDFPSKSSQRFPLYTSYRHGYQKCFSLDLSIDVMPHIHRHLVNAVGIALKDIRIPDVDIQYIISYPGQILRGLTIEAEISWGQRITSGDLKAKYFLIDVIEVFRKRNTFHESCNKNGKMYDDTVLREIIRMANCRPPHWKIYSDHPICNSKEKMSNVSIPESYGHIASTAFLKKFVEPCDGILSATSKTISERRHGTENGKSSAEVWFHFNNERYKEIKYTRSFDFEGLIGNVGGYIGLFLGCAIWQLPDAVQFIYNKLRAMVGEKIYTMFCRSDEFSKS